MKTYLVNYNTPECAYITNVVLVFEGESLEENLAKKDIRFSQNDERSIITSFEEVENARVNMTDLSLEEFLKVQSLFFQR